MKKQAIMIALTALTLAAPSAFAMDHEGHDHGHMVMDHAGHGMTDKRNIAHQEVVDGVRATFTVTDMKERMKGMGIPKGMMETHHIAVEFWDAKTGRALTEGVVKVKVQGPDGKEKTRDLMGMQGHFGADFDLSRKGKYGVMCRFKLKDGKVRGVKFWYAVK